MALPRSLDSELLGLHFGLSAAFLALDHKDPKDAIDSVLHPAFDSMIRDCTQIQNETVFLLIFDVI